MAKRELSDDEKEWLRAHVADPLPEQASHLGVCTDTVKRLHVALGLINIPVPNSSHASQPTGSAHAWVAAQPSAVHATTTSAASAGSR